MLIYPGHPDFEAWLSVPPPHWQDSNPIDETALVKDAATGLLRTADRKAVFEYLYGGEYDEIQAGEEDELWQV